MTQFTSSGPGSCDGWADSVFHRTFAALQSLTNRLAYRFNNKCGQWWEVNYVGEGIIDQGGGFRDLLAEISDELCPCDPNFLPVTPLFVRSPNNIARVGHAQAGFAVNPDCRAFAHYQWLGKLMGAALRSDESITLLLPPQFWKTLTGEPVSWDGLSHVDAQTVTFLDQLAGADEESFDSMFEGLVFTTPLSSARVIDVVPGGSEVRQLRHHFGPFPKLFSALIHIPLAVLCALRSAHAILDADWCLQFDVVPDLPSSSGAVDVAEPDAVRREGTRDPDGRERRADPGDPGRDGELGATVRALAAHVAGGRGKGLRVANADGGRHPEQLPARRHELRLPVQ